MSTTYNDYGQDFHVTERSEPLPDVCPVLLRPRSDCRCDECENARKQQVMEGNV